jgi:hypothetical protein
MTRAVLVTLAMLVAPVGAAAQESGDVGISMGYPANIAIIYHVSDGIAIRPDFNVSWLSSEDPEDPGLESSGLTLGFGVSGLFYTSRGDSLRTYVTPRFGYSRTHSDNELSQTQTAETTSSSYQLAGSFGAQYSLGTRFTVFGEAGVQYAWMHATFISGLSTPRFDNSGENDARSFGTRTAVGVVFYFN